MVDGQPDSGEGQQREVADSSAAHERSVVMQLFDKVTGRKPDAELTDREHAERYFGKNHQIVGVHAVGDEMTTQYQTTGRGGTLSWSETEPRSKPDSVPGPAEE